MSERENFNKIIRLLSGGGALVLRQLLEKYSAPLSFSDYVYRNQMAVLNLKFFENQRNLVVAREIDKMDITLLGKLLTGLFKDNMTGTEIDLVKNIKDERDNLMHSEVLKEAKLDENVFNRRWRTITSILLDIATEMGSPGLKTDIETLVNEIKETTANCSEIHEILFKWCESNEQLEEKVTKLEMTVQQIQVSTASIAKSVECGTTDSLKEKFQCNYEYNNRLDTRPTRSMKEAIEYLEKGCSVFLYGNPGEGKTFSAFRIVRHLIENNTVMVERCVLLSKPADIDLVKTADTDLILIDDVFGKHNPDSNRFSAWETEFPTLQSFVGTHKIRLIMCSRKHIYEEYKRRLDGLDIFARKTELSSANLSLDEKREMLIQQLQVYERNIDEVNVDECIAQEVVGFPLCAQQFACDELMFSKKTDYFKKPLKYFLEQNIKTLDDQSFIALLFVFYNGNRMQLADLDITRMSQNARDLLVHVAKLRGVEKPTSVIVRDTKMKIMSLNRSYIKTIDNEVSFFHDTIYEAVAQIHYEEYPDEVLKHCTLDYLFQCLFLEGQNNGDGITVCEADFRPFVERCSYELTEIMNRIMTEERILSANHLNATEKLLNHQLFEHPECRGELLDLIQRDMRKCVNFLQLFFYRHCLIPGDTKQSNNKWLNDETFIKTIMSYTECNHILRADHSCWKCRVKAQLLSSVCCHNNKDLYMFLRTNKIPFNLTCLYWAVINENLDTDFFELLNGEFKDHGELATDEKYLMQVALGMSFKQKSPCIANSLIASGLIPSTVTCYCAVRIGSDQNVHASVLFQPLVKHNPDQPTVHHVLKRIRSDKGATQISCELFAATKYGNQPFRNSNLILHGLKYVRKWAIAEREIEEGTIKCLTKEDFEKWESAMTCCLDVEKDALAESEVLNVQTALSTTQLLIDLTVDGFVDHFTKEQYEIISKRKTHDKSWNPEDAVICTLALIDEDLTINPWMIWLEIEPRDSDKTRFTGYRCNYSILAKVLIPLFS